MAQGQRSNTPVIREAAGALNQLKEQIAREISQTSNDPYSHTLQEYVSGATGGYGGNVPSRLWGAVGGNMVRRMIAAAEQALVSGTPLGAPGLHQTPGQFQAGQTQPGQDAAGQIPSAQTAPPQTGFAPITQVGNANQGPSGTTYQI